MLRGVLVWTFPVEAALRRARADEAQLLDACRCGEARGRGGCGGCGGGDGPWKGGMACCKDRVREVWL